MQILFIILLSCITQTSYSSIFRCEKPDGTLYFRERTCDKADIQNEIMYYNTPQKPKDIEKIERQLMKQRKAMHKRALAQQKEKFAAERQLLKQQKQKERNREKCRQAKRKIAEISQQYRAGYTVCRGITLDRKLAEYNDLRLKYCE